VWSWSRSPCPVRTRWAGLHRGKGACQRSWTGVRACNSALRACACVCTCLHLHLDLWSLAMVA
jgi:hypothetical protein